MRPNKRKLAFKRKLVCVAVASCFTVMPAFANPIGASVVNGQVGFAAQGSTLTITNTPNAIINWQQFSIGPGEITRFVQQSASSAVLNRVLGQDPSQILGSLLSNGRVFLVNPNGILFGQGAVIDVAGLVASTLRLSDGDFLAGRLNFTNGIGAGGIDNQGTITTPNGGNIYLIAPDIKNSGLITSPQGEILLAAGHTVNLLDAANPNVQVTLSAPDTTAVNIGTLMAQSGKIGIYGALIDQKGTVDANTAVLGANGRIMLRASKDITLEPGNLTTASGMAGGVRDGGEIRIVADGTLNMRQGSAVHVDGGVDGGNGGFLELSGKQKIALHGQYTGRAFKTGYHNGGLLLDPMNIEITAAAPCAIGTGACASSGGALTANSGTSASVLQIKPDMSAVAFATVTLAAGRDITVSSPITNGDLNPATTLLAMNAGNNINVSANIGTSTGARFNHDLTLQAGNNVNINANIYMGANTLTLAADAAIPALSIVSDNAGNVIINPGVMVDTQGAMNISGANLVVGNSSGSAPTLVSAVGLLDIAMSGDINLYGGLTSSGQSVQTVVKAGSINLSGNNLLLQAGGAGNLNFANANAELRSTSSTAVPTKTCNICITLAGGLTLNGGNAASFAGASPVTANAILHAEGNLTINATGAVALNGGIAQAKAGSDSFGKAHADASITAVGAITLTAGSLSLTGGNATATGSQFASPTLATANATIQSTTSSIKLTVGSLVLQGGTANANRSSGTGSSGGSGNATAKANALIDAVTSLTVDTAGGIQIVGGNAYAEARLGNADQATAEANATISVSGDLEITSGASGRVASVQVSGGSAWAYAYGSGSSLHVLPGDPFNATANANATVTAGSLTLRADSLTVKGGNTAHAQVGTSASGAINRSATAESKALLQILGSVAAMDIGAGGALVEAICNCGTALAYGAGGANTASADRSAFIKVTGDLTSLTVAGGGITVRGGNARADAYGTGTNTAAEYANAGITVDGSLQTGAGGIVGGLLLQGVGAYGSGASAHASNTGNNQAVAHGSAEIMAGAANITVTSGSLTLDGGVARASASSGAGAAADANALITVVGAQILNIAGNVNLTGGSATANGSGATAQVAAQLSSQAGGNAVVLAAGGNFINNAGASALSAPSGRWLIYSTNPANNTFGALDSGNTAIWNATYASMPPASVTQTGNRYLFSYQPTVTFTSTSANKTYGTDATAAVAGAYSVSGLDAGIANAYLADTNATVFSGAPSVTSSGSAVSAAVSGSPYAIAVAQGGLSALSGYAFAYQSSGLLTVDPLAIVLNGNKTYDGSTTFSAGQLNIGNIVGGDVVSLSTGSADTADSVVGSNKPFVSFAGLALTGAAAGNYTLTGVSGMGNITLATPAQPTTLNSPSVIAALNLGADETNNSTTVDGLVQTIYFGNEGDKEKKDDIPVCN